MFFMISKTYQKVKKITIPYRFMRKLKIENPNCFNRCSGRCLCSCKCPWKRSYTITPTISWRKDGRSKVVTTQTDSSKYCCKLREHSSIPSFFPPYLLPTLHSFFLPLPSLQSSLPPPSLPSLTSSVCWLIDWFISSLIYLFLNLFIYLFSQPVTNSFIYLH